MDDIAVIGLGLRFPGDASSPEALWKVVEDGQSQWSEIPKDRLNINGYYHPGGERQGSISFKGAHFLKENIANFDASFFSIIAADANAIDPQQRLLLEVCYEALENAGCTKEEIDGTDTSVYVGSFVKDYEQICLRDPDWQPQYAATGNGIAIMANRISYFFNLHGPSITVDTGCSGSLVSVHLAAQSLRTRESSLAIAAGAGLILTPNTIMPMTALNFLSPDGKCFTFDARANGYGRGEGIGVVILKRVSDAIRDNDTIRAVIRGTHVNQDGRTAGITLPSTAAQVENIRAVYKAAGLPYHDTAYVECHGTGTQAGDWRELKAISETLGASRTADNPIFVGSVKPNIGHLEGAAGVAGLIKAVLMLEHQRIPPHINFEIPNPGIDFKAWKLQVSRTAQDWPPNLKKRISINCFGFGGTNAHVILDSAEEYISAQQLLTPHNSSNTTSGGSESGLVSSIGALQADKHCSWQLFCISSNERSGIQRMRAQHVAMLENCRFQESDFLQNYAYTLGCRRSQLEWKSFFVAHSISDLVSQMNKQEIPIRRSTKEFSSKLCFLFCGQGSQWPQMGHDLRSFPVFLNSLNSSSWYLKTVLRSSYDLMDEIYRDSTKSRLLDPQIAQPATTAIQIALVDLMQSLMIKPDFVMGHSSGEIAAAVACGAISREEALEIAYYRGLAASQLQLNLPDFHGGMIAVSMTLDQANSYISALSDRLEIACVNSPNSITLSGKRETIEQVSLDLAANGIRHRILSVTMAYHSSYMKALEGEYVQNIISVSPSMSQTAIRMFSSVTGEEIAFSRLDASYWGKNMVSTVQFASGLESLMALPEDQRPSMFIEMGPSAVLRAPVIDTLSPRVNEEMYFSALDSRRSGMASVLGIVGALWASGYKVNVKSAISRRIPQSRLRCLPGLPLYPWNHAKSYWHESHLSLANRFREYGRLDLIGAPTADSIPFEPRWRGFLRISENPWMKHHQVQKTTIYPAAGLISMVLEGSRQLRRSFTDIVGYEIRNMQFIKAIVLPDSTHGVEVALNMRVEGSDNPAKGQFTFSIYSKSFEKDWEKHATGTLHFCFHSANWETVFRAFAPEHSDIATKCRTSVDPRQLYEQLDTVGITYGPMFRNILEVQKGTDCCISRVRVPDTKSTMPANFEYPHLLHPGTLDAMFQTLFALKPTPMIPYFIRSIFVSDGLDLTNSNEFAGYANVKQGLIHAAEAQISMCCTDRPLDQVIVKGLRFSGELFSLSAASPFLPNYRNLTTELIWRENYETADFESFRHIMSLLGHRYPQLSVLQVGGTLSLAKSILLSALGGAPNPLRLQRYTIVGESPPDAFFHEINVPPFRGYVENLSSTTAIHSTYHLIVVTEAQNDGLSQIRSFLKPGGIILQVYPGDVFPRDSISNLGIKHLRSGWNPTDLDEEWRNHTGLPVGEDTDGSTELYFLRLPPEASKFTMPASVVLLLPDVLSEEVSRFQAQFANWLTAQHPETAICSICLTDIPHAKIVRSDTLFISLLDFSSSNSYEGAIFNLNELDFNAFHSLQKVMKAIIWVTRGANMVPVNPRAASVIGLARTLMSENLQLSFATFDLDHHSVLYEPGILDMFLTVFRNVLDQAITNEVHEVDFAEKDGKLFIPRLETLKSLNDIIEETNDVYISSEKCFQTERAETGKLIALEPSTLPCIRPRTLVSPIYFKEFTLEESDPLDIAISFSAGVLYGRSVQNSDQTSMRYRSYDLVGTISSVGAYTAGFQENDKVIVLVPDGKGLRTTVRVHPAFIMHYKPGFVPSHFLCAYYALFNVGRICTGKTLLIHAGASGFGMAATELGLLVGATVFTTVIGPNKDHQKQLLLHRGVELDHILDGDNDNYTSVVDVLTGNRGVDIVYNPTNNIALSTGCVRRCGIVVHLTDSSENSAINAPPGIPLTVVTFDMDTLLTEDRDLSTEILHEVIQLTSNASLDWLSDSVLNRQFDISALDAAFKEYNRRPHVGSVIITANSSQGNGSIVRVLDVDTAGSLWKYITNDSTFVLVGGLGGLGKSIAELLVTNGAKYLAFLSRSGASSTGSLQFLETLARQGVDARAFAVDICDQTALQAVLENKVNASMPPICGVFHCAAVIKDAVFENMTYEHWNTGFKPKALGAWNLVEAIEATGQDPFFVFLASSAGVIGTRGQANYAAGNAVLDALARSLQLRGKRAISLDLGPILGAGMLADDHAILDILQASGFYGIRHDDFLTIIKHAITLEAFDGKRLPPQVILGVGTGGLMLQNKPADPYWSHAAIYSYLNIVDMPPPDLTASTPSVGLDIKSQLENCTDIVLAADIVCSGLSGMLAKSMNMAIEEVDPSCPPIAYGVDSLVAVGVRNWVVGNIGVEVSVFDIMSELTIHELSRLIAQTGRAGSDAKKHV